MWSVLKSTVKSEIPTGDQVGKFLKNAARTDFTQLNAIPRTILERLTSRVISLRTKKQLSLLQEKRKKLFNKEEHRKRESDIAFQKLGWDLSRKTKSESKAYGPSETLLYASYDLNSAFSVNFRVLKDLKSLKKKFMPKSVLDFGAGPGTSSWAAKEVFEDSIREFCVVEPSQSMLDVANVTMHDFPGFRIRKELKEMIHEIKNNQTFDLVVSSYVFTEISTEMERVTALSTLWKLLSPGGILVLIDQGNPSGSHAMRSARKLILDSNQEAGVESRAKIIAPCTHSFSCPMAAGNWCHFIQRVPKVTLPHSTEPNRANGFLTGKYSYVVIEKVADNSAEDALTETWSRLLRAPLIGKGHVTLDTCTSSGTIKRHVVSKKKYAEDNFAFYRASRKSHWGGLWKEK